MVKRISQINDPDEPLEGQYTDLTELGLDIDDQLESIQSEFDDDPNDVNFKISVYRVLPKTGRRAWMFDCLPSELPIKDKVRDEYGSGTYETRVYKNKRLLRRLQFDVEMPKLSAQTSQTSTDLNNILKTLIDFQQRQSQEIKEILLNVNKTPATPAVDPQTQMLNMMNMMMQMKQFMVPESSGSEKTFDMFLKGIEVAREMGGGGDTNFMDLIRDVVKSPMLGEAVKSIAVQQSVQTTPVSVSPRLSPPSEQKKTGATVNIKEMIFKQLLAQLCRAAARDSDPDFYAELVVDTLSEEELRQLISLPDIALTLAGVNPAVLTHKDWFEALKKHVIDIVNEPENVDSSLPPAT